MATPRRHKAAEAQGAALKIQAAYRGLQGRRAADALRAAKRDAERLALRSRRHIKKWPFFAGALWGGRSAALLDG